MDVYRKRRNTGWFYYRNHNTQAYCMFLRYEVGVQTGVQKEYTQGGGN